MTVSNRAALYIGIGSFVAGAGLTIALGSTFNTAAEPRTVEKIVIRIPQKGDVFSGRVTEAHDGDTPIIDNHGGKVTPRIWGIEAPELSQECMLKKQPIPCGENAREELDRLTKGVILNCTFQDWSYGRPVAICVRGDGIDIAEEMLKRGQVFVEEKYASGPLKSKYRAAQAEAQKEGRGLWAPGLKVESPEHWRACNTKKKNRPADCNP